MGSGSVEGGGGEFMGLNTPQLAAVDRQRGVTSRCHPGGAIRQTELRRERGLTTLPGATGGRQRLLRPADRVDAPSLVTVAQLKTEVTAYLERVRAGGGTCLSRGRRAWKISMMQRCRWLASRAESLSQFKSWGSHGSGVMAGVGGVHGQAGEGAGQGRWWGGSKSQGSQRSSMNLPTIPG